LSVFVRSAGNGKVCAHAQRCGDGSPHPSARCAVVLLEGLTCPAQCAGSFLLSASLALSAGAAALAGVLPLPRHLGMVLTDPSAILTPKAIAQWAASLKFEHSGGQLITQKSYDGECRRSREGARCESSILIAIQKPHGIVGYRLSGVFVSCLICSLLNCRSGFMPKALLLAFGFSRGLRQLISALGFSLSRSLSGPVDGVLGRRLKPWN
jgi:hypothetical protein